MTTSSTEGTLTAHGNQAEPSRACSDYVFLILDGSDPGSGGARYRLRDLAALRLGRGKQRSATIEGRPGHRRLNLEFPDRKLSSRHMEIERDMTGWQLRDAGSKNGTTVCGELTSRRTLADGDTIEVGQCLLVFREQLADSDRAILELGQATPDELFTLLPGLAIDLQQIAKAAASRVPVLLQGETGTGKEVVARGLHRLSQRAGQFVALNCGAIPASLVESELFGHRKGAFTGAETDRLGYVRRADGGTLLLDELGDLPLPAQAALLRVLNDREVVPVGDTTPVPVDFRLISATHRDLEEMTEQAGFRADLLGRVSGFQFVLPPLRERREDLGWLIARLLPPDAREAGVTLSAEVLRALHAHGWPRNIRELRSVLEAACALADSGPLEAAHLPAALRAAPPNSSESAERSSRAQRAQLVKLLREHRGNVSAIARSTGKARMQIQRWLKRFGLDPASYRAP